jgi:hypothetical protein
MASNDNQSTSSKGKKWATPPDGAVNISIEPEEIFNNAPPNWWIIQLEEGQEGNTRPHLILAYVDNDQQTVNSNTFAVCYYNNQWHGLGYSISRNAPIVGKPYQWLATYNLDRVAYTFTQDQLYYRSPEEWAVAEKDNKQPEDSTDEELSVLAGRLHVSSISQPMTDTMTQLQPANTSDSGTTSTIGGNKVATGITPTEVQEIIWQRMRHYTNP